FSDIFPSTPRAAPLLRRPQTVCGLPQTVLIVTMIMSRRVIPGQGGNDLGRLGRATPCCSSKRPSRSRFGLTENQRYRANGTHDRYSKTVIGRIVTRKT